MHKVEHSEIYVHIDLKANSLSSIQTILEGISLAMMGVRIAVCLARSSIYLL